jgi:hypothetical protein
MIQTQPPNSETAEISLFGPGVGECIVLHYGNNNWFIVDSCVEPTNKFAIALQYLKSLGIDVAKRVKGILITHWHSDHIDGAYQLAVECKSASIHASAALLNNEAFTLASLYRKNPFSEIDKEIREFRSIIEYLKKEKQYNRLCLVAHRYTFFHDPSSNIRLVALSPSPAATTQSIADISQLLPKNGQRRSRLVTKKSENLNAVALHFSFGNFSSVLGSDLEDYGNTNTGWSAIFDSNLIEELNLCKGHVYKVAHHGSITAHNQRIWDQLLETKPLTLTTPYSRSHLPKECDIDRISDLSSSFLLTRNPKPKSKVKHDNLSEKWLKRQAIERYVVNDKMGHIQLRISKNGELTVAKNSLCVEYN